MAKFRRFLPLVFAGLPTLFLIAGWLLYDYSRQVLVFPLGIGICTVLLCLVVVFRPENPVAENRKNHDQQGHAGNWRRYLIVSSVLPVLGLFGFQAGLPLYVTAFLRLQGESWKLALGYGLGTLLFIEMVFRKLLNVVLPGGWFG